MRRITLLLVVVCGLGFFERKGQANELVSGPFPIIGGEYTLVADCEILPPQACEDGHIVFLEHGFGPWFRVAFNVPSVLSWKPPEVAEAWINLDHVVRLDQVPERRRLIRIDPSP